MDGPSSSISSSVSGSCSSASSSSVSLRKESSLGISPSDRPLSNLQCRVHQIKQIFHSPKFVVGFCIFLFMLLFSWIYPAISPYEPQQMVGNIFYPPGKYVSVTDTANNPKKVTFDVDAGQVNLESVVTKEARGQMVKWLTEQAGVSGADSMEIADLIAC